MATVATAGHGATVSGIFSFPYLPREEKLARRHQTRHFDSAPNSTEGDYFRLRAPGVLGCPHLGTDARLENNLMAWHDRG